MNPRVVVFMPVRERPEILAETIDQLRVLSKLTYEAEFWFCDDNDEDASSEILREFLSAATGSFLETPEGAKPSRDLTGFTHAWSEDTIGRVTLIKDAAIERFLSTDADYLFLLDADVALHPETLDHLVSLGLPIVSEVFWTEFIAGEPLRPNVWDWMPGSNFWSLESAVRLRHPGTFEVGGLGACTLIHRTALEAGVRFAPIPNLRLWGEDRHLCVRAAVLGIPLYADTHLPPVHLYRPEVLQQLRCWRAEGYSRHVLVSGLDDDWEHSFAPLVGPSPSRTRPRPGVRRVAAKAVTRLGTMGARCRRVLSR